MAQTVEIRIPSDPAMLKIVRSSVAQACSLMGFKRGDRNNIVLAVDEACTNIIKHAYNNEPNKPIIIVIRNLK